jgi:hypothetical protein
VVRVVGQPALVAAGLGGEVEELPEPPSTELVVRW